jgi:beta-phosphoglucomutase-like phosphatase (HAD superfamily)
LELAGLARWFQAVVAAEDVHRGKPDPEVFVTAAARLGTTAEHSVVFEDAHAGLRAGRNGGMKVVAVTTTHPADSLASERPDRIVASLAELDVEALRGLWQI